MAAGGSTDDLPQFLVPGTYDVSLFGQKNFTIIIYDLEVRSSEW